MICQYCKKDFEEQNIQLSHNVPKYLFCLETMKDNERKNKADKLGRHNLCEPCHKEYEKALNTHLKWASIKFAKEYFYLNEVVKK